MKKRLLFIFTALSCLVIALWPVDSVHSNGGGAPNGYTGSPNEFSGRTCGTQGGCHGGGSSSAAGALTSDIPACGYTPGVTYNFTLTFGLSGRTKFGFSLSPQRSTGATGGTLVEATNELQIVSSGRYLTHTSQGTASPIGTNSRTWTFQWIAPAAGSGTVTFYYAINATNSNSQTSGDLIFNSNLGIQEATPLTISTSGSTNLCPGQTINLTSSILAGNAWVTETGSSAGNAATITTNPGFNTYILTNTNGACIQKDTVELIVTSLPEVPVITVGPDGNEFCEGFSTTLTVENETGISWAATGETGPEIIVDSAGFYIATATNNCGAVNSEPVEIIINSLPEIPLITADGPLTFCLGDSVVLSTTSTDGLTWQPQVAEGNSITVTQEGEYTVSAFNECGLITSEGIFVDTKEVPDAPNVTVSSPDGTCEGSTISLNITNLAIDDAVSWTPGNSTDALINVTENGTYSAVLTNNCGASEATATEVNFTPIPETPGISLNDQQELESSVTGASYVWTKDGVVLDGATTLSIAPQGEGAYTVTVLTAEGCESEPSSVFNFTTIGIGGLTNNSWSVFPNPSQGNITVVFPENNSTAFISLSDLSGRLIKSFSVNNSTVVQLGLDLEAGLYWLDAGEGRKKLIVIR